MFSVFNLVFFFFNNGEKSVFYVLSQFIFLCLSFDLPLAQQPPGVPLLLNTFLL